MRDVSFKVTTRRSAIAQAVLTAEPATIAAIRAGKIPKGDPLPIAKVAAVMAAKKTVDWIPYCHPIPIEYVDVRFELKEDRIIVDVEVVSIAKTGVEMEALTAAAAAALNLYDMLKMLDETMEIIGVRLLEKRGGKSDHAVSQGWSGAVLVVSDRAARGDYADKSGDVLREGMASRGASEVVKAIVPDEEDQIRSQISAWVESEIDVVLVTGGTGIGPRDRTPEALESMWSMPLPGVVESLRRYGQDRLPTSMFSRSAAGVIGNSLVVSLPGSPAACADALAVLFPGILHARSMLRGGAHP